MKIIYMGTPDFAVYPLKKIAEAGHEILCVVTQPDRPKNRGKKLQPTPVKIAAEELGIEVVQPEKIRGDAEFEEYIKSLDADLAVVAAYGQILPKEILDAPKYGCVNIHASMLPKLRGAAPIQRAILEGYIYSGVTLMKMDEGMDTGNIITKEMTDITGMNAQGLHDELSEIGAGLIVELLEKAEKNGPEVFEGTPQDDSQATYAPMIKKSDGLIDFNKTADEVLLQMLAMDPWPGAFTYYKGTQIKLRDPEWYGSPYDDNVQCGTIVRADNGGMVIQCRGSLLLVKTIQFPNRKAMSIKEFLKGNELECGVVLGQE